MGNEKVKDLQSRNRFILSAVDFHNRRETSMGVGVERRVAVGNPGVMWTRLTRRVGIRCNERLFCDSAQRVARMRKRRRK